MLLAELTASAPRLALVGLAKNTGKTVALNALVSELDAAGTVVGVTSVGRDGEEHDVIDFRIDKPRVRLLAGSLLASTDALLRDSGLPHEVLRETGVRTPLGRVAIARLLAAGEIEVAGPSGAADVREAADAMLELGAERVLIDGAIDRRAASSPQVSDGLVIASGAVLSREMDEVVRHTRDAVALALLAGADQEQLALARAAQGHDSALLGGDEPLVLEPRFALTASEEATGALLDGAPEGRLITIGGALPEAFLERLARAAKRRQRRLVVLANDSTRIFLTEHGPEFFERMGLSLRVRMPTRLLALTVNPVAPRSHELDSGELRRRLSQALPEVPVLDVLHPSYRASQPAGTRV